MLQKHLKCKLKSPCQTRWIERHDSILQFTTDLPLIVEAFREILEWNDNTSSSKANILLKSLCDSEFILTMFCLSDIFSITLPLSKYLQGCNIDLNSASNKIKDLLEILEKKRANADEYFKSVILRHANEILQKLEVELKFPRLCSRQTKRDTFSDFREISPTDYWNRVLFIPTLDHLIVDLKSRFNESDISIYGLNILVPNTLKQISDSESLIKHLQIILGNFSELLGSPSMMQLMGEVELYKKSSLNTDNAVEALKNCDRNYYPNVYNLLKLMCSLTVSVATAERSFSNLRILKSYLRSTMAADRLNGLALMSIATSM